MLGVLLETKEFISVGEYITNRGLKNNSSCYPVWLVVERTTTISTNYVPHIRGYRSGQNSYVCVLPSIMLVVDIEINEYSHTCIVTTNNINCSERKLRYMVKGWGWNVLDQISWKHSGWWLSREDPLWCALRTLGDTDEAGSGWGRGWATMGLHLSSVDPIEV